MGEKKLVEKYTLSKSNSYDVNLSTHGTCANKLDAYTPGMNWSRPARFSVRNVTVSLRKLLYI